VVIAADPASGQPVSVALAHLSAADSLTALQTPLAPSMRSTTVVLLLGCAASLAGRSGAQQPPDVGPYLIADRSAEIALARSAAPRTVSDSATVLVLARSGFVEATHGSNGFTCVVIRSFSGDENAPGFWNPRVRAPYCFNAPAARTVLPPMLAHVGWLLSGTSPTDAGARLRRGYASGKYPSPESGSMVYMMSSQQYLSDEVGRAGPHLMFYFDRSRTGAVWGATADGSGPIIDGTAADPNAPVLTLIIPVRRWSDGSSAISPS